MLGIEWILKMVKFKAQITGSFQGCSNSEPQNQVYNLSLDLGLKVCSSNYSVARVFSKLGHA